ncbi:MAG: hypothetical protein JWM11_3350 [Planctomycetaceae bacterium]|nr:hypothetical protein [Planctomycetaceae bacterium]
MQYEFTGTVVNEQGVVIFQQVSGVIDFRKDGAFTEWDGWLEVESGEELCMFDGVLVIGDRHGTIGARRVSVSTIEFRGSGQCPVNRS